MIGSMPSARGLFRSILRPNGNRSGRGGVGAGPRFESSPTMAIARPSPSGVNEVFTCTPFVEIRWTR